MDGLGHYPPASGYPAERNTYSNGPMQPPQQAFYRMMSFDNCSIYSPTRHTIVMGKVAGERSFGMTLEQTRDVRANDFPRVSHVFDNSAAYRSGIRRGWIVESINGVSCQGRSVREVASVFRDLHQVTLQVDITEEGSPQATPAPVTHSEPSFPFPSAAPPPPLPCPAMLPNSLAAILRPPQPQPATASSPACAQPLVHHHPVASTYLTSATTVAQATSAAAPMSSLPVPTSVAPVSTTSTQGVPVWHVSRLFPVAPTAHSRQRDSEAVQSKPSATVTTLPRSDAAAAAPPPPAPADAKAPPAAPRTDQPKQAAKVTSAVSTCNIPREQASQPAPPAAEPKPTPTQPAVPSSPNAHASPTRPAAPSTPATTTTPAQSEPTQQPPRSTGKKRARGQQTPAESGGTTSATTGRKRGGRQKKKAQAAPATELWDSDDAIFFYGSDASVEEVDPPANSSGNRRYSTRQAESGGRQRRSLTVSRLMTMGFTQEDAEASVEVNGHDPDKCMLWIVSHLEEKQFLNDLNKASIESEQQKRLEAQEQKKQETETLRQATTFTSLFPTSYILSGEAEAPRVKEMLSSTIGSIAADTLMRTLMTKLLTVESKAIRWYKEASRCYMLQLAARLETAFGSHDAVTCCSQVTATEGVDRGCSFVRALHEEERALTKALFDMPENQGGVPVEFLRADESMQFNLDDDGFEVVEMPSAQSPGPE